MKDKKKNYWGLIPTLVLDREKYRGRGRPRTIDYRIFPGPQDFKKSMVWKSVHKKKDGSYKIRAQQTFKVDIGKIVGSIGK